MKDYAIECLAKTTVDFLLDCEKSNSSGSSHNPVSGSISNSNVNSNHKQIQRSISNADSSVSGEMNPMSNSDETTGPNSLKSPNLQQGSVGPGGGPNDENDMMSAAGEAMDTMIENGVNSVGLGGAGGIGSVNGVNDSVFNDNNPNSVQNNGGGGINAGGQFDQDRNVGDFDHGGDGFNRFYQEDFFDAYNVDDEEDFYDQYEKFKKSGGGADGHAMNGVWLVAPLILRLPYTCQIKVLDNACKLPFFLLKKNIASVILILYFNAQKLKRCKSWARHFGMPRQKARKRPKLLRISMHGINSHSFHCLSLA
jgi:hypothetical protein